VTALGRSLQQNDPAPAERVAGQRDEFGQLARLVVDSFAQRAALEREIVERRRTLEALEKSEAAVRANLEERARLGRDLHDGVIQTLYAAGMGLASVRTLLDAKQTEAAVRLEQTRAALNETIHDVRNFIIGLEPESLKLQTFSQAVAALLEVMRGHGDFEAVVAIDDALANRLTLTQRVNALQMAREAVSNALRHGAATRVEVALRPEGEFAAFEVRDNGSGFDSQAPWPRHGRGLASFAERARELGGTFKVESARGEGTCVRLVFSYRHE
jgi:signal transduction histidine kinase